MWNGKVCWGRGITLSEAGCLHPYQKSEMALGKRLDELYATREECEKLQIYKLEIEVKV